MRNLFLILLCCVTPNFVFAQDSTNYSEFRFTIVDVSGHDLTNSELGAKINSVFFTDTTKKDLEYVFTKLDYSKKDSCWILSQNEPMGYNYKIDLFRIADTINEKLLDIRKMTLVYKGFDEKNNSGCQYCICNDIPYKPGEYSIDIPRKVESWLFIRSVHINVKNVPVEFRDISSIQNWFFRDDK